MKKKDIQSHITSALITFVATFLFFFCGLISADSFTFSKDVLYSTIMGALISAVRAVAKFVYIWAAELLSSKSK